MGYFFGLPLGSIKCAWLRMYSSTATAIKLLKGTFAPPVKPCNATRMRESFWSVSGLNRTLIGRPTFSESAFAIGEIVAISGIGGNTVATVAYMYYNNDMYDTTGQLENGGYCLTPPGCCPFGANCFTPLTIKSDAVVVHLTKGKHALIDRQDVLRVSQYVWHTLGPLPSGHCYAEAGDHLALHRLIMRPAPDQLVDHINNNGLDCRRKNMRIADKGQNTANRHTRPRASGIKGVHWHKAAKKFCAQIRFRGRRIYLGLFESEADAARAYDNKARELWGEFANVNQKEIDHASQSN